MSAHNTSNPKQNSSSSNWKLPADLGCLLFSWVPILVISIFAGALLSVISKLKAADVTGIFYAAVGFAGVGTVLLLLARLPLYRQRQFLTLGPKHLDSVHRKLYWAAYVFVLLGFALLGIVWLRLQ